MTAVVTDRADRQALPDRQRLASRRTTPCGHARGCPAPCGREAQGRAHADRGVLGAPRRLLRDRAGRGGRDHRPQRRRQVDAAEDPLADHRADGRAAPRCTGRVASLLEVGTGFHPELTGRENIFLNGAILGMRRREIQREVRRDRRVRRGREVPRHAGQALLVRHVRAARVRGRRASRAGDPDRRRGARGRRRGSSRRSASAR